MPPKYIVGRQDQLRRAAWTDRAGDLELSKDVVISGPWARLAGICYHVILSVFISLGVPMATATANSKGQITIPAEIRAELGLNQGDRVEFVEQEGGQFAMVAAIQPVQRLKGMIHKPKATVSIEDVNRAVARRSTNYWIG